MSAALQSLMRWRYSRTTIAVVLIVVYLFPVYWMVATGLKSTADIFALPPHLFPIPPDFTSYVEQVLNNPVLLQIVWNSLVISTGTTLLTLVLAVPGAYALARQKIAGGRVILLVMLVGQLLPSIVVAGPLFVIFSRIGLLNTHLGLILADTTFTLPFSVVMLRPFFLSVPHDLEDAARVDGAGPLTTLWSIVIPCIRPGLITVAAFSFLIAWGEFVFAVSLNTRGTQSVTVALNKFIGQYGTHWNDLMAVSTVVALPIIVLFALLQRFIVGGLTAGAVKD